MTVPVDHCFSTLVGMQTHFQSAQTYAAHPIYKLKRKSLLQSTLFTYLTPTADKPYY